MGRSITEGEKMFRGHRNALRRTAWRIFETCGKKFGWADLRREALATMDEFGYPSPKDGRISLKGLAAAVSRACGVDGMIGYNYPPETRGGFGDASDYYEFALEPDRVDAPSTEGPPPPVSPWPSDGLLEDLRTMRDIRQRYDRETWEKVVDLVGV